MWDILQNNWTRLKGFIYHEERWEAVVWGVTLCTLCETKLIQQANALGDRNWILDQEEKAKAIKDTLGSF